MRSRSIFLGAFCFASIVAATAFAGDLAAIQVADAAGSQADHELDASMAKMHKSMMQKHMGDADVDFVKSMIPHHQGAIDMAEIELKYGKDPEMKKMAESIIKAQKEEISMMQDWLKKKGEAAPQ